MRGGTITWEKTGPSCPKLPEGTRRDTRHIPASHRVYFALSRAASASSSVASINAQLSLPPYPPCLNSPGSPPPRRDGDAAPPPPHTKRPPAATGLLRATPQSPPQPAAYEQGGTAPSGGGIGIVPAPAAAHRRRERRAPVPSRRVPSRPVPRPAPGEGGKRAVGAAAGQCSGAPGAPPLHRAAARCRRRQRNGGAAGAVPARSAERRERGAARPHGTPPAAPQRESPAGLRGAISIGGVQSPASERLPRPAASISPCLFSAAPGGCAPGRSGGRWGGTVGRRRSLELGAGVAREGAAQGPADAAGPAQGRGDPPTSKHPPGG